MSFSVALQSAAFYFLACTPCAKVRHRQKAAKAAKKEREEKARLEAAHPGMYNHPSPFNTNPYWNEEITMGPTLSKKGTVAAKNPSQRRLVSAGSAGKENSAAGTQSSLAVSNINKTESRPNGAGADAEQLAVPHSPSIMPEDEVNATLTKSISGSLLSGEDWNKRRYEREDEELWGHELSRRGHQLMDALKHAGGAAGRIIREGVGRPEREVTDEDRINFYATVTNPPVNDYHPPVVRSKPGHKDAYHWMLQPPPPAKVMEGKVPVSRSASMASSAGSLASRRTATADGRDALGRRVGERAVEAKLRKGEAPGEGEATAGRPKPQRTKTQSSARSRATRSRSVSLTESDASSDGAAQARRTPRRIRSPMLVPIDHEDEDEYISRSLEELSNTTIPAHAAQRPRLSTIMSSDAAIEVASRSEAAASLNGKTTEADPTPADAGVPLKTVTNAAPGATASVEKRPSGASIDSGLALHS